MKKSKNVVTCVFMFLLTLVALSYASITLEVFVMDEAETETNITKPRIYFQNTGTQTISDFLYYYYIKAEKCETQVLYQPYYVPNEQVTLEHVKGSLYRVKYSVSGINLQPGQYHPNTSGNVIGIHYNDWSAWDKSNDFSNPGSSTFVQSNKIAVYVNGNRIHGTVPDPENPFYSCTGDGGEPPGDGDDPGDNNGQPSISPGSYNPNAPLLMNFALFSLEQSILDDRGTFSGQGAIGSNGNVLIGHDASVYGNIVSAGDVHLQDRSMVNGDVMLNGNIHLGSMATINGSVTTDASVAAVELQIIDHIQTNDEHITVENGQKMTLAPGAYGDASIHSNCTLIMGSGLYSFKTLFLRPDAHITFDLTNGPVDIQIAGHFEMSDRSVIAFAQDGYAPDAKIYTNSSGTVRIGNDVTLEGIITAPNAEVRFCSRAQCRGALYARRIVMEPDAVIEGEILDPFGDESENRVPNFIEVLFGTDPFDPTDFPFYAWVTEYSDFDNSNEQTVYYDFSRFYSDYIHASNVPVTFPAGFLRSAELPPVYRVLNKPSSIPAITKNDIDQYLDGKYEGYMPVGRYFEMYANSPAGNGSMLLPIPIPAEEVVLPHNLAVAQYRANSPETWHIDEISHIDGNVVYFRTSSFGPAILIHKTAQTVMYSDNSVYSSSFENVGISVQVELLNTSAVNEEISFEIQYSAASSGELQLQEPITENFELYDGSAYLMKQFIFPGPVLIHSVKIESVGDELFYSYENDYFIEPGACAKIEFNGTVLSLKENVAVNYPLVVTPSAALSFEYASINGEGIVRKSRESGSDDFRYSYNFYLKDHLGSTRMVINDQNRVTEAVGYKPYGAMVDISGIEVSSELPVREKFTGKEFDKAGGINAYHFGARLYDPEIGRWISTDELEQFYDKYLYSHVNPVNFIDVDGRWSPLMHFFHGGWYAAKPDLGERGRTVYVYLAGRTIGAISDEYIDASQDAHEIHSNWERLYEYALGDKPAGLSDREWRGMKRHVYGDFLHHGDQIRAYSPLEALVGRAGGRDAMEWFQDAQCAWPLTGFAPAVTTLPFLFPTTTAILGVNWLISMSSTRFAVLQMDRMIERRLIWKGHFEGNPQRTSVNVRYDRQFNVAPGVYRNYYDYDTFIEEGRYELREKYDLRGRSIYQR